MSFFTENWILILVAFVSGGMLVWPLVQRGSGGGTAVNTTEAVRLINRERGVLVDVSEAAEFAQGHAKGARHIPFGALEGSKELPSNKALPLILVCPTGARASRAVGLLRKAGYEKAVAVAGGTAAWREASLPIARAGEAADKAERTERPERADKAAKDGRTSRSARRNKGARPEQPAPATAAVAAGAAATTGTAAATAAAAEPAAPVPEAAPAGEPPAVEAPTPGRA